MRTPALLALSFVIAVSPLSAQHPKPQHTESQADSNKSRKAFGKHEKAVQKKMDKQRKAEMKQFKKQHPASHPPATDHKSEATHQKPDNHKSS